MTENTHTPGPWKIEDDVAIMATVDGIDVQILVAAETSSTRDSPIYAITRKIRDQREHNLALAAAAPDLLAALKTLRHIDGCFCEAAWAMDGAHPRHSDECEAAQNAIAKAEGRND